MAAGKKDEKPGKAAGAADDAAGAASQKKKKMIMFIGAAVLLVILSVGATFFVVSKMMASKSPGEGEGASSSDHPDQSSAAAPAIYYPLKPNFTVNFDVNGRQRFLQTELTLVYRDAEIAATLEKHMPQVRNGLVLLLSGQSFDELQTVAGKEKLRADALETVQDIIARESAAEAADKKKDKGKGKKSSSNVERVLFTHFVMQ